MGCEISPNPTVCALLDCGKCPASMMLAISIGRRDEQTVKMGRVLKGPTNQRGKNCACPAK